MSSYEALQLVINDPAVLQNVEKRLWNKVDRKNDADCWPWEGAVNKDGYGSLRIAQMKTDVRAHRIAYAIAHGLPAQGIVIMHLCDNPKCCNPAHLAQGLQKDNMRDMDKKNRRKPPIGINNGSNKLTENQVREIKALLSNGKGVKSIAKIYNLTKKTVFSIKKGNIWKHIN